MSEDAKLILEQLRYLGDRMSSMEAGLASLKSDVAGLKEDVAVLKSDVTNLKSDVAGLEKRMTRIEKIVTELQATLENETNRNIRIIAEGHYDLNRRLDESMRHAKDVEIMKIHLNILESEVRRLKEMSA